MSLQIRENPQTRHAKAVEAADARILEMIDKEIKQIHPAWRQNARAAVRFLSKESHLFDKEDKDAFLKHLQRFHGLVMYDDTQAETIEKTLMLALRMYHLRKQEIARLSKGFSPLLIIDRKEPEVKSSRKNKKPELRVVG